MLTNQSSFRLGEVSTKFDGDMSPEILQKKTEMAAEIHNMDLLATGGVQTRKSFEYFVDGAEDVRLFNYKTNNQLDYLFMFSEKLLQIVTEDGVIISTLNTPYNQEHIFELCIIQKNGDILICHQVYPFIQITANTSTASVATALPMNRYANSEELAYIKSLPLDTTITDADITRLPPITRWRYQNYIAKSKGHIVIRITKEKDGLLLHSAFTAEISVGVGGWNFINNITNINWDANRGTFNNGFAERLYGKLDVYETINALQGDLFSNSVYASSANNTAIAERLYWVCQYLQAAYNKQSYPNVATIEVQERIYNLLPVKVFKGVTLKIFPNSPQDTIDAYHNFYVPFNFQPNSLNLQAVEAISSVPTSSSGGFNVIEPKLLHSGTEELRPKTMTFHQDRLVLANTKEKPDTLFYSRVHGYFDFTWQETNGAIPPDHGIEENIKADNSFGQINHVISANGLYIFKTETIFLNDINPITTTNSGYKLISNFNCSTHIRPIFLNGGLYFLDNLEQSLNTLTFFRDNQVFNTTNLTLLVQENYDKIIYINYVRANAQNATDSIILTLQDGTIYRLFIDLTNGISGYCRYTNPNILFLRGGTFYNNNYYTPTINVKNEFEIMGLVGENYFDGGIFKNECEDDEKYDFYAHITTLPINIQKRYFGDNTNNINRIKKINLDVVELDEELKTEFNPNIIVENNNKTDIYITNISSGKRWDFGTRILNNIRTSTMLGAMPKNKFKLEFVKRVLLKSINFEL